MTAGKLQSMSTPICKLSLMDHPFQARALSSATSRACTRNRKSK